jgi:hypothetical protein
MSVCNLRSKLPTKNFLSVIQSVTTNKNFSFRNAVGNYRRKIFVGSYRLNYVRTSFRIEKKGGSLTWRFWRVIFSDELTDGFKTTARTVTWPVRHLNCRWTHRGIWNGRSVRWRVDFSVRITDVITDEVSVGETVGKS